MEGSRNRFAWASALSLSLIGVGGGFALPAFAQQADTGDPNPVSKDSSPVDPTVTDESKPVDATGAEDSGVTTIVVTAQKREEPLQDVPISIAVINAATLDSLEFNETTDLQYLVPGLSSPTQAGPRNFGFFVRGVGTTTFSSETIEPSTGVVIDGVVLGQGGAALSDLPDIERIEVLRGPQGTLFGKNASAGIINIVTRRPSKAFEVRSSVSWSDPDDEQRYTAYVSGPMTDTLRYSLSGRLNRRDGYVKNVLDGREFNDRDDNGYRGKLEWEPSEKLRATLTGDWWHRDAECCIWTWERFGPPPNALEQMSLDAGIVTNRHNLKQNIDGDVFSDSKTYGSSLQVDYGVVANHTLTWISGWRTFKTRDGLDSDSSPVDILNTNFGDHTQRQFSQELRLTSPTGQFVEYVAGLYYFRTKVRSFTDQFFPTVPFPFFDRDVNVHAKTVNLAAFGQANVNLTEDFRLILGARTLREKQEVSKDRVDARLNLADEVAEEETDHQTIWRSGLQYDFTRRIMAFATVTRGFKAGGFDTNIAVQELRPVGPEKPRSYEVGLRTEWPDQNLTLNLTAFKADIKGYQTASRNSETLTFPISNGDADTKGVELDSSWQPLHGVDLVLGLAVAYTDAQWGSFTGAPCYAGQTAELGCISSVQDLTNERLPFAPEWSTNLTADYSRPITERLKLSTNLALSDRSKQVIGFPNSPDAVEHGYTLFNAAIGLGDLKDRWKLSVFGKNIGDEKYRSYSFNSGIGSAGFYRVHESRRIVGLGLDVAF